MSVPLRSKTSTIDIYIKLAQYPILADKIRTKMRGILFAKGIVNEEDFEKEVQKKAIESQRREGLYDPFNKEPAGIWQKRKARIRDFHTDFYFGFNFPTEAFEEIVETVLANPDQQDGRIELGFNPELAPWEMLFRQGEIYESLPKEEQERAKHHLQEIKVVLIKGMISDQLKFIGVAKKVLSIADLRRIYNRRIGEGKIGGKAAGMVLAWRILQQDPALAPHAQVPESYFIGSEVIYDFRRLNGLDYIMNQKYRPLEEIRAEYPHAIEEHLNAKFPESEESQLAEVLDLLGKKPIIVRSSSLLEDNFGFSFAGKYDSYFCPNQGTPEENLRDLIHKIKLIYASTLNPDAILYRQKHGLIDYDERMAILLQVVDGEQHGRYYFPTLAGVGFSHNAYRWHEKIRREDGFLRLVWGMGTRAVDRTSSDYARLIGLSHPQLRPETTARAIRQYSQKFIDLIDIETNEFTTRPIEDVLNKRYPHTQVLASINQGDYLEPILSRASLRPDTDLVLTFDPLIKDNAFVSLMRDSLQRLNDVYKQPVDTEFTIKVEKKGLTNHYTISLLQCRPLSQRPETQPAPIPSDIPQEDMLFTSRGLVPDGTVTDIRYLVYVDPEKYKRSADKTTKLEIGRVVSRLNQTLEGESFVLMGPGRWGSSNLDLGVKVTYADIYNTKVLIEIAVPENGQIPELSYGTHFFQDLVEAHVYSLPIHLNELQNNLDWSFFTSTQNQLATILPEDQSFADYIHVVDIEKERPSHRLTILMNGQLDKTVGYLAV